MKKVTKTKHKVKLSKTTGTALSMDADGHIIEVPLGTPGSKTPEACVKCKIDNLSVSFQNEDMNKVVGKINEMIDKLNDSI